MGKLTKTIGTEKLVEIVLHLENKGLEVLSHGVRKGGADNILSSGLFVPKVEYTNEMYLNSVIALGLPKTCWFSYLIAGSKEDVRLSEVLLSINHTPPEEIEEYSAVLARGDRADRVRFILEHQPYNRQVQILMAGKWNDLNTWKQHRVSPDLILGLYRDIDTPMFKLNPSFKHGSMLGRCL